MEYKFKKGDRVEYIGYQGKKHLYNYDDAPLLKVGMQGTVLEDNSTRPWIEFDHPTGYQYCGLLSNKKDYVYCVGENDLKKADFTLKDLQFADILTLKNKEKYVYASYSMYGYEDNYDLSCGIVDDLYNNNLKIQTSYYDEYSDEYDIMKVERNGQTVYERDENIKEMTLKEVCDELGYEVKIVKEER